MCEIFPDMISILIVEDDEIDVEAIERAFRKKRFVNPLYHADCGQTALDFLYGLGGKEKISQPCLMLVDINMPRMNGIEFLQHVKRDPSLKNIIAFILTTSAREADIAAAYDLNVAGYFLKQDIDKLIILFEAYRDINKFPVG